MGVHPLDGLASGGALSNLNVSQGVWLLCESKLGT